MTDGRPPLRDILTWQSFWAIVVKEFIQMRRDQITLGMMVGIPLIQLILFGFAINTDPKDLPTAILSSDHSPYTRAIIQSVVNTGYFDISTRARSESEADHLMRSGDVQFILQIPPNFTERLLKGDRPQLLLVADATDPTGIANAVGAMMQLRHRALQHDLKGALADLQPEPPPFDLRVHRRYNPERITHYNIVPALIGVILTMTMMMLTALSITRERERGTMEHLLSLPVRPMEVMLGKVVPYILVGYVQVAITLLAAYYVFGVPVQGNLAALALILILFIATNLLLGFTFSTLAYNQLQAVQMSFFFFLPSILLSGFMFPFEGMPEWAQVIGEVLPLTHFVRIVRGILLKDAAIPDLLPDVWPIAGFLLAIGAIALLRYRQTLD